MMGSEKPKKRRTRRLDTGRTTSDRKGIMGLVETFIRSFHDLAFATFFIPIVLLCVVCLGVAITPAVYLMMFVHAWVESESLLIYSFAMGMSIALGFFIYGVTLIFVVPLVNFILPLRVKPWKGIWYSLQTVPWYVHNALTYIVRYTFLDFITPSPLNVLFFKMMGMKIGKGVMINTSNISDPALITLEDKVTIGGSAHLFAHYGQKGILILSPVVIKKGATIGLKASVMGDVIVGERAMIRPHSVLLPKTRIADGETV